MEYSIQIVNRNDINSDCLVINSCNNLLCPVDNISPQISKVSFLNGLILYIGGINEVNYTEILRKENEKYNYINSVFELQSILTHNYSSPINYSDCCKIFNYFKNNSSLINEVI